MQLKTKKQTRNTSVFDLLFFMHVSVLFYVSVKRENIKKKILGEKKRHYSTCIAQERFAIVS